MVPAFGPAPGIVWLLAALSAADGVWVAKSCFLLALSLSYFRSLSLSLPPSLAIYLSLSLCLSLSRSLALPLSLAPSLPRNLSLSLCLSLPPSHFRFGCADIRHIVAATMLRASDCWGQPLCFI